MALACGGAAEGVCWDLPPGVVAQVGVWLRAADRGAFACAARRFAAAHGRRRCLFVKAAAACVGPRLSLVDALGRHMRPSDLDDDTSSDASDDAPPEDPEDAPRDDPGSDAMLEQLQASCAHRGGAAAAAVWRRCIGLQRDK